VSLTPTKALERVRAVCAEVSPEARDHLVLGLVRKSGTTSEHVRAVLFGKLWPSPRLCIEIVSLARRLEGVIRHATNGKAG
jgi:hypothetical protein